jgi:hypothetical protein
VLHRELPRQAQGGLDLDGRGLVRAVQMGCFVRDRCDRDDGETLSVLLN